jgi:hypothetical protein
LARARRTVRKKRNRKKADDQDAADDARPGLSVHGS